MNKKRGFKDLIRNFITPKPEEVEGLNNSSYIYWTEYLWTLIKSIFKIENAPDTWKIDYIMDRLFRIGYLVETDSSIGDIIIECAYYNIDPYNFPTDVMINNPILGSFYRPLEGEDKSGNKAELIYFEWTYSYFRNLQNLVTRTAILLAQCDGTLNTSLMNSRVCLYFEVNDTAEMKSAQAVYDAFTEGKPAVFMVRSEKMKQSASMKPAVFHDVKNSFMGNDILDTQRTILCQFLTQIGIGNANTDKKERLITSEVNANAGEVKMGVSLWIDTLNACMERANKKFGNNARFVFNEWVLTYGMEMIENEPYQSDVSV